MPLVVTIMHFHNFFNCNIVGQNFIIFIPKNNCIYYYLFSKNFYQEKAQQYKVNDKCVKRINLCSVWTPTLGFTLELHRLEADPTSGSITCNPSDWDVQVSLELYLLLSSVLQGWTEAVERIRGRAPDREVFAPQVALSTHLSVSQLFSYIEKNRRAWENFGNYGKLYALLHHHSILLIIFLKECNFTKLWWHHLVASFANFLHTHIRISSRLNMLRLFIYICLCL